MGRGEAGGIRGRRISFPIQMVVKAEGIHFGDGLVRGPIRWAIR